MALGALAVSIVIGAALRGTFRSTIGEAVRSLGSLGGAVRNVEASGSRLSRLGTALAPLGALGSLGGTMAGGLGIGAAVKSAMDFEAALMDAAITADMTDEKIAKLRARLIELGRATFQSKEQLLSSFRILVSSGLEPEAAEAALEAIARTATASKADIDDLSKSAFVLLQTLNVKPEALAAELDRLAFAGKKGAFELKDMARELPTLAAAAKKLGLTGSEAVSTLGAALQITKEGAGSAGEAANNLLNLLQKITSPEALKNFQEKGINLTKVMDKAMAEGRNPLDTVLATLDKILARAKTGPQRAKILGELFGDMQVQNALNALLPNLERYRDLKNEISQQTGGTVLADFIRRIGTSSEQANAAKNALWELGTAIGDGLLPPLGRLAEIATPAFRWLSEVSKAEPTTTAAFFAIGAAWKLLGTAFITNPIGATITGLALGAALIVDNWDEVKRVFTDVGSAWGALSRAAEWIQWGLPGGQSAAGALRKIRELEAKAAEASARKVGGGAGAAPPKSPSEVSIKIDGLPKGSTVQTRTVTPGTVIDVDAGISWATP